MKAVPSASLLPAGRPCPTVCPGQRGIGSQASLASLWAPAAFAAWPVHVG